MNIFKNMKINKLLKELEPDVDKELISMNLLTIDNGKKNYALGSTNIKWKIQKRLLKERYNIDWNSPQDKNSNTNFD